MRRTRSIPPSKAPLKGDVVSISGASPEEESRWLRLADIALHTVPENYSEYSDTSLETRRKIIRLTEALLKRLGVAA